jgi:tetratricopeptide (TPR) repeat protein
VRLNLGLCYLGKGDLERGRNLIVQGIARCSNKRLLSDLLNMELSYLEEASEGWSFGTEMRNALNDVQNGVKVQIRSRMAEIAQHPLSAEEELEQLLVSRPPGDAGSWLSIGARAGLARLHVEEKRWSDAVTAYQFLHQQTDQFPEARLGPQTVIERVKLESDRLLKEGDAANALKQLSTGLTLVQPLVPEDPKLGADLHGRMGFVHFVLADSPSARSNFEQALALYRTSGQANPGTALGTLCLPLLRQDSDYWSLDEEWKSLRSEPQSNEELQRDLADAELSLSAFLKPIPRIGVDIGSALLKFEETRHWPLFRYLPTMRERLQEKMGVVVPAALFRDDSQLPPASYVIKFDEIPIARGSIEIGRDYCTNSREVLESLGIARQSLLEVPHPLTGEPGCWVDRNYREIMKNAGLEPWEEQPDLFLAYHLEAVLRANLAEFVGFQDTKYLLRNWSNSKKDSSPVAAAIPDLDAELQLARLLRALVKETVTISPLQEILEVAQNIGLAVNDISGVLRAVRLRLKRLLPGNDQRATRLPLPSALEAKITPWLQHQDGKLFLAMPPEVAEELLSAIRVLVKRSIGHLALVSESAEIRPLLHRLVEVEFPDLMVLSRAELTPEDEVRDATEARNGRRA